MISIAVMEASQVAEARREAATLASQSGFGENDCGRVALVATELATNLVKHGGGGELLIGSYQDNTGTGIELIAIDRGPGIANVEACLKDGHSSAGTAGNGLGAVIRQSQAFNIASWPGVGTAVLARIEAGPPKPKDVAPHPNWGAVSVAMPGQEVCGDSWTATSNEASTTLFVADGLGHGQDAADAAVEAIRLFHRFNGHQITTLLDYIHGGLRSTRGAAVSIARFDPATQKVVFAGIGNVAGGLSDNGQSLKRMVTMPGTAGHNARKIQAFDYPFRHGFIVLASDGISTSWNLDRYLGVQSMHPSLVAAMLYRDFGRHRDDATILVGKWAA